MHKSEPRRFGRILQMLPIPFRGKHGVTFILQLAGIRSRHGRLQSQLVVAPLQQSELKQ